MLIRIHRHQKRKTTKPKTTSEAKELNKKFYELLEKQPDKGWHEYKTLLELLTEYIKQHPQIKQNNYINLKALLSDAIYLCQHQELRQRESYTELKHNYTQTKDMFYLKNTINAVKKMITELCLDFCNNHLYTSIEKSLMQKALSEPFRYCVKILNVCNNFNSQTEQSYIDEYMQIFEKQYN